MKFSLFLFFSLKSFNLLIIFVIFVFHQSHGAYIEPDKYTPGQYHCANHKFEIVNASIFAEPEKVKRLVMADCGVKRIVPNAFVGLINLKEMSISFNPLTEIKKTDFIGLNRMRSLILLGNKIKTIQHEAFNLPSLIQLTLMFNPLGEIDLNAFTNKTNLQILFLGNTTSNIVYQVGVNTKSNLKHLSLAQNYQPDGNLYIQKLGTLHNLKSLNIAVNTFNGGIKIKSILDIFPNMIHFYINNCRVTKLGNDFKFDICVEKLIGTK